MLSFFATIQISHKSCQKKYDSKHERWIDIRH